MTRIIGIDPGSLKTGYGIIESDGVRNCYVASGCIRVKGDNLAQRLGDIFSSLHAVIVQWQPDEMAIEQVFMSNNADSALKLGQARGAAICAGVQLQLPVSEYAAREIKNAVVGSGSALKQQVQHMMRVLLKIDKTLQADEADALGVALCHAHHRASKIPVVAKSTARNASRKTTRGRWQAYLEQKS